MSAFGLIFSLLCLTLFIGCKGQTAAPAKQLNSSPPVPSAAQSSPNEPASESTSNENSATAKVEVAFLKLLTAEDVIQANIPADEIANVHKAYTKHVEQVFSKSPVSCHLMITITLSPEDPHELQIAHQGNAPEELLSQLQEQLSGLETPNTAQDKVSFQTVYKVTDTKTAEQQQRAAANDLVDTLTKTMKDPLGIESPPPPDPGVEPAEALAQARQVGWTAAASLIAGLEKADAATFPGAHAWLGDYRKATDGLDPKATPNSWPEIDIDELVTHNPNFWQAYYEIAPGDPGLMMLHAALLQGAGEISRSSYIIALAKQRPNIDKGVLPFMNGIQGNNQQVLNAFNPLVRRGIELFDAGDYSAAAKQFEETLEIWPQYGWCLFELGLTTFFRDEIEAGREPPKFGTAGVDASVKLSERVVSLYESARWHDPLSWRSYQGSDQKVIQGAVAWTKFGLAAWKEVSTEPNVADQHYWFLALSGRSLKRMTWLWPPNRSLSPDVVVTLQKTFRFLRRTSKHWLPGLASIAHSSVSPANSCSCTS